MKANEREAWARRMAEQIMQVRAGVTTAAEAAQRMGVSRKTYYKWEQRALTSLLEGLCERNSGRPASVPDEEKERLKRRVLELEKDLRMRQQTEELRALLRAGTEKKGGEP